MNLLPIVYTSLLIFSIFIVLLVSISFTLYKLKGHKAENINSDSTFVLRRPVTIATATTKIVYQRSSRNSNSSHVNVSLQNENRKSKSNLQHHYNRTFASAQRSTQQNPLISTHQNRYKILTTFDRIHVREETLNNRFPMQLNSLNYYDNSYESPHSFNSGNYSQL